MRHGNTAGFLGIVVKVCLCVHIGVVADDLDGVLVGSDSSVRAKSPELTVDGSFRCGNQRRAGFQRKACHIIFDTDGESCFVFVVEYRNDLLRCGILGSKSVTSAVYRNVLKLASLQGRYNVQVQRLALCARLFGPVKNVDIFYSVRDRVYQCLRAERTIQTYLDNAHFLACSYQVVDSLLDGITYRTHCNDDFLSVCSSVVVKQLVVCSDLGVYLVHVFLNDRRHSIVVRITCLSCLEEDIRVLSGTSLAGMIRIQCVIPERVDGVHIHQILQVLVIPGLDLLDLMRSTETVEEVDERQLALERCAVRNRRQVHNLLYAGLAEHGSSGLTTGIYIGVISENGKCVAGDCTGGYVEHTRKLLARYLIQVGDHQKQTLRSGKGSGQSACRQRSVYRACSAGLRLHLCHLNRLSEDVLSSFGRPLIYMLRHNR